MILILTNSLNYTIQELILFFNDNNINFVRLNIDEYVFGASGTIQVNDLNIFINGVSYSNFNQVIMWKVNISTIPIILAKRYSTVGKNVLFYKSEEYTALIKFIINQCENKVVFGYHSDDIDKLSQYSVAKKIGLKVPSYLVSSKNEDINKHISNFLIKPIFSPYISRKNKTFCEKLSDVNFNAENVLTKFPFLLQKIIDYNFEVRVFYFCGEFYAGKIISLDTTKQIDYRIYQNYYFEPFILADSLKKKLSVFIFKFDLHTAVFDLLYTASEVYFLEANPTGNFIGLINQCGYDLKHRLLKIFKHEQKQVNNF